MTNTTTDVLRDPAAETADKLQRAAASALEDGKERAGVLLDQSGDAIESVSNHATEGAADLGSRVIAFTKQNPMTALLLAVGAGALLASAAKLPSFRR